MIDDNDIELNQFLLDKLLPILPKYSRQGTMLSMRCPICGDSKKDKHKRRGVLYTTPKVSYYCFNCDVHLSGFNLLKALAGETFHDIMSEFNRQQLTSHVAQHTHVDVTQPEKIKGKIPELTPLTAEELTYIKSRRITELPHYESLHLMNAKVKDEKSVEHDFVFIPWLNHNKISSFQLNNFKHVPKFPKYIFQKHADKCVYGLDRIDQSFKYVICFEGVFDSIFVKNGVAIGGTNLMPTQEAEIRQRYPKHEIVLAFDADAAGLTAIAKYIEDDASTYKYFIWFDSDKVKDINNVIINDGDVNKFNTPDIANMIYSGIEARFLLTNIGLWLPKKQKRV